MKINSIRFGEIEVFDEQLFSFPKGLPGFPYEQQFVFLPSENDGSDKPLFAYLQSTRTPELTFILVDPFAFFPEYEFVINDDTEDFLETSVNNIPMIWSVATVKDKIENMTINLLAPVLFNVKNKKAIQMILDTSRYTTRHKIFSTGEAVEKAEGDENVSTES